MIKLMEKQKIIIAYHNKQKPQRAIARELGLNRRTVVRYIKDYDRKRTQLMTDRDNPAKEELTADIIQAPGSGYDTSSRKRVKLATEIADRIQFYLQENERRKKKEGKHKQKRKNIDIYEALQKEEFDIGYTSICNLIRKIKRESKEAYIRQEYAPGEVCGFDWGEARLTIAGKSRILHMAVF